VQRQDDNADVIRERLTVFANITAPLIEYYRTRPTFAWIDGLNPPERVTEDLKSAVEAGTALAKDGGRGRARV
jgi:adenylate kinase